MVVLKKNIERVKEQLDLLVEDWPRCSRLEAAKIAHKYGPPHEATASRLSWIYNSPWKQTTVWREGARHNFPRIHRDVVEQTISLAVPVEKVGLMLAFHGSLTVSRTRGELTICCQNEPMNILAINLAQRLATNHLVLH